MTIERLKTPSAGELDALTDLWEASVRATHDFLAPEDIVFFRQMVRQEALRGVELYVIRKPDSKAPETGTSAGQENRHESRTSGKTGESRRPEGLDENGMFGGFAAFAGIDGDMLEMLFVAPKARGKGVGRQLVEYLVRERGIRQVDVNEDFRSAVLLLYPVFPRKPPSAAAFRPASAGYYPPAPVIFLRPRLALVRNRHRPGRSAGSGSARSAAAFRPATDGG